MRIEKNERFHGLEVYFNEKPEKNTIEGLKRNGFRWHSVKKCWFAKETEERTLLVSLIAKNTDWQKQAQKTENAPKHEKNKKLIDEAGKIYGRGKEKDAVYFSGNLFDALTLDDGRILTIDKKDIETRFCFGEHGFDFDEKQQMAHNAKSFDYFESENLQELEQEIKNIQETLEKYDEKTDWKPILFFYRHFWCDGMEKLAGWYIYDQRTHYTRSPSEFDEVRPATKQEIQKLLNIKKAQFDDMKKRLATWWKRYGAEHLHTWTYWADA